MIEKGTLTTRLLGEDIPKSSATARKVIPAASMFFRNLLEHPARCQLRCVSSEPVIRE